MRLGSSALFILALATRETAVTLPVALLHPALGAFKMIPVVAVLAAGGRQLGFLLAIVVLGVAGLVARFVSWMRFTYAFDGNALRVEDGVLERRVRTVPASRIQQVDVRSKLRHRAAGVVELRFDTAGGSGEAEVTLSVIGKDEADKIKAALEEQGAKVEIK